MSDYHDWKPYVPAASRRLQAARELIARKKAGQGASPVIIPGRKIADTFWGRAWCDNLESYSDFSNRLPRGRTYVRNGSVVDLRIEPGAVRARVSGSMMYQTEVTVAAVPKARWSAICKDCAGAIDSLVELLQGRFSKGVMERMCQQKSGLFPAPTEIDFSCSCPDWAYMCKHVAAVLYGIGARLDHQPELLFALRKVNQQDLIAQAGTSMSRSHKVLSSKKVLDSGGLSQLFGIDLAADAEPRPAKRAPAATRKRRPQIAKTVKASKSTKPVRKRKKTR